MKPTFRQIKGAFLRLPMKSSQYTQQHDVNIKQINKRMRSNAFFFLFINMKGSILMDGIGL